MMEILENKKVLIIGLIVVFIFIYALIKQNLMSKKQKIDYQELLNKDEYKVKGQWDF